MEIRTVEETRSLVVRTVAPVSELSKVMGSAYGEIAALMGSRGLKFAGPPYALYHNMDMEALDLEIGFPQAAQEPGDGRVVPGRLPAGRVVVAVHQGPYDKIGESYEKMAGFVKENGLKTHNWSYEFYLNSPEDTPPEKLQTEIYFPIRD